MIWDPSGSEEKGTKTPRTWTPTHISRKIVINILLMSFIIRDDFD